VSSAVHRELARFEEALPEMDVFEVSPARNRMSRQRLREVESRHQPDLVFTLGGPAYVKFRAQHLLVCAEPWVTHAGLTAYRALRFPDEWLMQRLFTRYKTIWFRQANAWILQTETARQGFIKRVGVPADRCYVVPATCDPQYRALDFAVPFPAEHAKLRLLCLSAYYKHKNLEMIPQVAHSLQRLLPGRDFEFVLTLRPEQPPWKSIAKSAARLGVQERLVTLGPIPVAECPALYQSCHISFLPTVLEMFSATYPEAMAMGMPIVTSNLDFAHEACRDAALYFSPRDPADAAQRVAQLASDPKLWNDLVTHGKARLAELPSALEQYQMDLRCIRQVLERQ
jgi:glycosyltransferase involved in cell wall biosynthesis